MTGENFVSLTGKLFRPELKEFESGAKLFKAQLGIPDASGQNFQYIKIACWGDMGQDMYDLRGGTVYMRIHGHIEESFYDGTCMHCSGKNRKYYTEVIVDNFVKIDY